MTRILTAIIVIISLSSLATAKVPVYNNREEIPSQYKWNLKDIYPNWEAWQKGFGDVEAKMKEFEALKGTLANGPDQLLKVFKLSDELQVLSDKVYSYPNLMYVVDTKNNDVQAKVQQVRILFAKFGISTSWLNPEIVSIPKSTMDKWLKDTPDLAPYKHNIENLYRQQQHILDADGEKLLSYYGQFDGTPSSIYTQISTSDIKFNDVVLSTGDTVNVTEGKYDNILSTDRNQEDRQKAFEALYGVYNEQIHTYAAIYNAVLQRDWADAQARNYSSTLEASLDGDNVPTDVFTNLITTVKAHTDPVKRYMRLRKDKLGLKTYHPYDGLVPIVKFDTTYSYDDITKWVIAADKPLGKDYEKKIAEAFKGGWIDVYENPGKSSGAFSTDVYGVHPYILLNYQGTLEDIFTVAHETGHSIHSLYADENQPISTAGYSILVAEVASTLDEALMLDYMLKRSKDPLERITLLQQAIDNILGTFYTQVLFADFEWRAHQLVEQGQPVTSDVLAKLYLDMNHEYYGDAETVDSLYGALFARISHFYYAPYYVYKYATSFASSSQFAKEITTGSEQSRKEAVDRYLTLLKSGGDDYPIELLKKAGVDLTTPQPVLAVIDRLNTLVDELETELNKLN